MFTVKILARTSLRPAKTTEKSLVPSRNRHYVSGWCQRKRTYQQTIYGCFFVLVMKFTTTYHYQSNINASFIIIAQLRVNNRHKMSADGIRFSLALHVMSVFNPCCCPIIYWAPSFVTAENSALSRLTQPSSSVRYDTIRYDTIRDVILTCTRKPTWVSLIYRTEPTTKV